MSPLPPSSKPSGAQALAAWLKSRAPLADQLVAPEEALLSGRFTAYALRRLTAFGLARGVGVALHVLELTWLAAIFSARPFVASLALQNVTLVIDAAYWGALEALRRRSRELGESSEASALATRWLTTAFWAGLVIAVVPIVQALAEWRTTGVPPSMLHVYALACALRLAADIVLRTYYSGVYAFRRVHRALWSFFLPPVVLIGLTLVLWNSLAGWSFPLALVVSVGLSRGALFVFARRAYRDNRITPPRWRLVFRPRRLDLAALRAALLAGAANLTTRLGGVVLLAAVVPSLSTLTDEDDMPFVEPFALSLHLAAPLLLVVSQWSTVFYHDWKRLEGHEASVLARVLHRRLMVAAILVGVFSWAAACVLVRAYVPAEQAWPVLVALLPSMLGMSVWSAIQLRGFAHGEFGKQIASALAMLLVLWATLSATSTPTSELGSLGPFAWYATLAAGPWTAVVIHTLLAFWRDRHAVGEVATVAGWVRSLEAARGDVVAYRARVSGAAPRVIARIVTRLGDRGAAVRVGDLVWWFERAPHAGRTEWLRLGAGAFEELAESARGPGHALLAERVYRHESEPALDALGAAHAQAFRDGFTVIVGGRPPARFVALSPAIRQAIWRDGLRVHRGGRARTGWFVSTYSRHGALEALFIAPRPVSPDQVRAWRERLKQLEWRIRPEKVK